MSKIIIGQEIEGYCGKCKIDTLHIITAIDDDKIEKVMCKVCMSYHKFKKTVSSSPQLVITKPAKTKRTTKTTKRRIRRDKWTRMLEDINSEAAIEYEMYREYELETPIHHKIFGLGVVKSIIDDQKIGVLFHDGEKILVQNLNR